MTDGSLTARAEDLADTGDLAEMVAGILGRARGSRVDPDALTVLVAAAMMLGAGSLEVYHASGPAYADDREYAEDVDDAEDEIAAREALAAHAQTEAKEALDDAYRDKRRARADLAAARAMPTHRPCDGCHDDRRKAIDAAKEAIAEAQERIDDATEAAAILGHLLQRLSWAKTRVARALPDLGEVYEAVYEHVDAGRVLPADGDFLTGEGAGVAALPAAATYPCANCSGTGISRLTAATCDRCAGTGADPYALR